MKTNEIKFIEYFEENLKGKTSVLTVYITEAYFHYYQKQYFGGTCNRCLSGIFQELKDIYKRLKDQQLAEVIVEEPIVEKPKTVRKTPIRSKAKKVTTKQVTTNKVITKKVVKK